MKTLRESYKLDLTAAEAANCRRRPVKPNSSKAIGATERRMSAGLSGTLVLMFILSAALAVTGVVLQPPEGIFIGIALGLMVLQVLEGGSEGKFVKAGIYRDVKGKPAAFTLGLGDELVTLFPGMSWTQVDRFKWCARGVIDEPHVFHVLPDGSVEINWKKITLADREGEAKLQTLITSRHVAAFSPKTSVSSSPVYSAITESKLSTSAGVQFKVKLDRFGHMQIYCHRGGEIEETGLRGLSNLIANGSMLKPEELHVDPMQRAIEIDGIRFECTDEGARHLEEALNTRYAPTSIGERGVAIEVKENVAASTGFDIHFLTLHAGVPVEVRGHLTQENLDILQDTTRCDLLQPGIQLRLSPPHLLIRRRRSDMGEDKIPGVPDINYLQVTAAQIQQTLNHPLIRRGVVTQQARPAMQERPSNVQEIRLVRIPGDRKLYGIECVTTDGERHGGKAFTHHNIAELQQRGFFLAHLDVCLSLDNAVLSILNKQTKQEESIRMDERSSDEDLLKAGAMLTRALKPSVRVVGKTSKQQDASTPIESEGVRGPEKGVKAIEKPSKELVKSDSRAGASAPSSPEGDSSLTALFGERDSVRINRESFRRLSAYLGIEVQDIRLSLPMVFTDRRFEIVKFEGDDITDVAELRDEWFYGFYLSHINERKAVLVYGCNGTHIEWGPDKCVLQRLKTEPEEYPGSALLGLAQDSNNEFVFVVQRAFKEWIKMREKHCVDVTVYFLTVPELIASADDYKWIWPERPAVMTHS